MKRLILSLLLLTVFFSCKKQFESDNADTDLQDSLLGDTIDLTLPTSNGMSVIDSSLSLGLSPTIVILGSSTAEGIGATSKNLCWAELLKSRLIADNKNIDVVNLALAAQTTSNIMPSGFKSPVGRDQPNIKRNITTALSYRPLLIIISMPTNDIAVNFSDEEILSNFKIIVSKIDSAKIDYILTGTQPRNFAKIEDRKRLKVLNDKLKALYADHIIDILKKLSKQTYLIADYYANKDGIHLNNNGHRIIFQHVLNSSRFQRLIGYDN